MTLTVFEWAVCGYKSTVANKVIHQKKDINDNGDKHKS